MPSALSMPKNRPTGSATKSGVEFSQDSAGTSGVDFAQIMSQQFMQLPNTERQQVAASTVEAGTSVSAKTNTAINTGLGLDPALHSIDLSPRLRIITASSQAPTSASLTVFAQSMGLDVNALQQLLNDAPAHNPVPSTPPLNTVITPTISMPTPDASSAAAAAPAPLLPDITTKNLPALTQIQITVFPTVMTSSTVKATTTPIASAPTTVAALSLVGGALSNQDIDALARNFEQGDTKPDDEQPQNDDPLSFDATGLIQPLNNATHTDNTTASTSPVSVQDKKMTEIYDQLSEKLTTEMTTRMHKQISNGEWKTKFDLHPALLGSVEIQLEMKDGKLQATLHADNPLTRDLLQNNSHRLRESLENFGTHSTQVNVGQEGGHSRQQQAPYTNTNSPFQAGTGAFLQRGDSEVPSNSEPLRSKYSSTSALDLYA